METHWFSGIPHKRPRIFIMAFDPLNSAASGWPAAGGRHGAVTVNWPRPVPLAMSMSELLDPLTSSDAENYTRSFTRTERKNWRAATRIIGEEARKSAMPPEFMEAVVDLGGSEVQVGFDLAPCLTRSRGRSFAFWSYRHRRPLNVAEMCRMQGLCIHDLNAQGITDKDLGAMLGNAYPCTMIARLVSAGLKALMAANGPDTSPDGTSIGYDSWRGCLGKNSIPLGYLHARPPPPRGLAVGGRASGAVGGASGVRVSGRRASGEGGRASGQGGRATRNGGIAAGGRSAGAGDIRRHTPQRRPARNTPQPQPEASRRRTQY